jgi:Ca2+-binding RTX toxin-like protein
MAIFKYFPDFNDNALRDDILFEEPTSLSSTQVVQELDGYTVTYTGTFDLGGPRYIEDGTITGMTISSGNMIGITITELNIDAIEYLDAIETGSIDQVYGLLSRANDKVFGTYDEDFLSGGGGNDVLKGYKGSDGLFGKNGSDKLYGGAGADYLEGGSGSDKLYGGSGEDYLDGGKGSDRLNGGKNNDYLEGKSGKDVLLGGGGQDYLLGGGGADKLNGGKGDDGLFGGKGADIFVFRSGGGSDVVYDFKDGVDMIDINQSFQSLTITDGDFGAEVSGDGWNVVLHDVTVADLTSADFM